MSALVDVQFDMGRRQKNARERAELAEICKNLSVSVLSRSPTVLFLSILARALVFFLCLSMTFQPFVNDKVG